MGNWLPAFAPRTAGFVGPISPSINLTATQFRIWWDFSFKTQGEYDGKNLLFKTKDENLLYNYIKIFIIYWILLLVFYKDIIDYGNRFIRYTNKPNYGNFL